MILEAATDDPYPFSLLLTVLLNSEVVFFTVNGIILIILLLMSAMISGSEVAFFSLSSDELAHCKTGNSLVEKKIIELLDYPKRLLATILILNNLVNVAFVTLSTFISWQIVGTKSTEGVVVVTLTFIVTFCIVFFGEVVPKVYANHSSLSFIKKTAIPLSFCVAFFKPLSWLLMSLSNIIERRVEKRGYEISLDGLNQALEITGKETSVEEKGILKGIVNFGTISAKQVMRSRMDITAVDIETDFHELMDKVNKSGYSRIPAYNETIDRIEGVLYIKDLLPYLDGEEDFEWQKLLRPGFFIPESKKIDALLKDFQEKRVHMAIIVDEYGGTSGIITLEDVIEEIVGEINDEFDDDDIAYNKLDEQTYIFEGKTSLNDFCKILNEDPDVFDEVKGESESLGGLLLEIYSKLPRVGEKVSFDKFVFTVVSVDTKKIKRVRVFLKEQIPDLQPEERKK